MDENNLTYDKIVDVEISDKMKSAYIDYAMSVIVSRALPDVRDGKALDTITLIVSRCQRWFKACS